MEDIFEDRLFIGEELDTPPEEKERVERETRLAVFLHRLRFGNEISDDTAKKEAVYVARDTRGSIKKINGHSFDESDADDEEDPDEQYLDEDRGELSFGQDQTDRASSPSVGTLEERRMISVEMNLEGFELPSSDGYN